MVTNQAVLDLKKATWDQNKKGFTLIELLVAIAVIGILMAGTFYLINTVRERARLSTSQTRLRNIQGAILSYEADTGEIPQTLDDLASQKGRGPYIKKPDLKDGWNNKFNYRITPEGDKPYELYSFGSSQGKRTPKNKWIRAD